MSFPAARRWARAAGAIVLALVCALAFLTVIVPLVLGAQSYTVLTGSMRPALDPGHLIAVRETPIDEIAPGDIVTFQLESGKPEVATHRVVGIGWSSEGDRLLITRGDANNVQDENPVQEVQLRGVMVYAVPWLGYLNVWATPAVKSVVITVVGVGAVGWGLIVLLKDSRRRRQLAKAAAAVATAAVLLALSPAMASPAMASPATVSPATAHSLPAASTGHLLLSADGITWTGGSQLTILDASQRVVPGDDMAIDLWIRNESADPAEFTVTGVWMPANTTDAGDVVLADDLVAPRLDHHSIEAGASIRAPLRIGLSADSDSSTRSSSASLIITVTLTQAGTDSDDPLATTGASIPAELIIAASVLVGAGLLLLILRAITAKRRNRRDP